MFTAAKCDHNVYWVQKWLAEEGEVKGMNRGIKKVTVKGTMDYFQFMEGKCLKSDPTKRFGQHDFL